MSNRKDINIKNIQKRLLAHRQEVMDDTDASEESRQPVELDQTSVGRLSRMDALQGQAMALETDRRRHVELQHIDAALKLIDEGEYGYCQICDEEIPVKRLDIDPTASVCIDCASK
ncbi:MAG: TraR/DksA family transcriptional regulator [Rhodospirillaceae bacterium]|jgi:DnaK suppressor protein|nr:TraR/DksA family transcriptional regulator [Rhodospirillaceae bacterium]MBT4219502.1 TraR/DksA family transcriptional regulator [Rhodospirillaceae bacterium]MBT5308103.1 TraR/DksA family transcriptional regulator [Rhodospirillaceae bacterium]MBT7356008.1 TraR/DksA family transcriptional regulator [Rhodospirillaceae bacterium]